MKAILLLIVLALVWYGIAAWAIGAVLGAWGLIPAIIVGVLLLAPRRQP